MLEKRDKIGGLFWVRYFIYFLQTLIFISCSIGDYFSDPLTWQSWFYCLGMSVSIMSFFAFYFNTIDLRKWFRYKKGGVNNTPGDMGKKEEKS